VRLLAESTEIEAGQTIVAVGRYRGKGLFRVDHARSLKRRRPLRFRIRQAVAGRIERLYGARAPMVEAMVLGRREDVDRETRSTFVAAGLAHLLAISGLHVGILAGWVALAAGKFVSAPRVAAFSAVSTWLYVAILGFPAPATRAAAFITIGSASRLLQRHPPVSSVVAVAVLVVLTVDTGSATAVGAWLSVAAVWGTGAANSLVAKTARYRALSRLFAGSVGATLWTAPITAFACGSVAPIGILANLPAIPLAAAVVPAVFLSMIFGETLAGAAGLGLAGIETVGILASRIPGGHVSGEPGAGFALPWCLLLAAVLWVGWRRPVSGVVRQRALACGLLASGVFAVLPVLSGHPGSGDVEIHFLDVGQGDAIVLRTPRGRWVLIDGGPRIAGFDAGKRVVLPFLRQRGVRRLDVVVVSHGDADHLGGVPAVIEAMQPSLVIEPGQALETNLYLEFLGAVESAGSEWRPARRGDVFTVDSVRLAVLHPTGEWTASQLDQNENSVVLRLTYGTFDVLFTGDVGWVAESLLVDVVSPVEVLKVGHHGSGGSTTGPWLSALRPRVAVISVGRQNNYGHPDGAVLERLREHRVTSFRTDIAGTVTIRSDGNYFQMGSTDQTAWESVRCILQTFLPLSASSSSKSACTPKRRDNSPISFTTLP
jgi:competence protein ComEC